MENKINGYVPNLLNTHSNWPIIKGNYIKDSQFQLFKGLAIGAGASLGGIITVFMNKVQLLIIMAQDKVNPIQLIQQHQKCLV